MKKGSSSNYFKQKKPFCVTTILKIPLLLGNSGQWKKQKWGNFSSFFVAVFPTFLFSHCFGLQRPQKESFTAKEDVFHSQFGKAEKELLARTT